jgi:hypothetical protein
MIKKPILFALLLVSAIRPISTLAATPAGSASKPVKPVSIEWRAPASQAESVIDSLEVNGSLKVVKNPSSDTKAFPVLIIITGLVVFEKLSVTLLDIYRESRPGAIVQKKPDGKYVVTQVKNLPPGCVIYDYGTKVTECIFSQKNSKEDPTRILLDLFTKLPGK